MIDWGDIEETYLKFSEKINDNDRILMLKDSLDKKKWSYPYLQKKSIKPKGIWYGIGLEWIRWCKSEMPHWLTPYIYKIDIDTSRLKKISTAEEIFSVPTIDDIFVEWSQFTEYAGIEINPYIWECRLHIRTSWYYGWDCASGCIWNPDIILATREILL